MDPREANLKSETSTVVPSRNESQTDFEKKEQHLPNDNASVSPSGSDTDVEPKHNTATMVDPMRSDSEVANEKEANAADTPEDGDDEPIYPTGLKFAVITLALCLAVFLVALDNTM